ncbi:hypothetical protein DSAG12_03193 [Promethearchaeum syntrophicum]|uniref:Uncharacterized protein n=1 Tax=Promethearchaeum syntrophicum TaxID=2594042 RepID=A0A5B9DEZ8_9ARCH|nr:hypothetical protein [Candidatus Prometheoarchaeum syntrophicum]QEE17360.1 hypothetical protein DSAG12_03193 [Candidatus Prometheoarchaeum syntrophicum]
MDRKIVVKISFSIDIINKSIEKYSGYFNELNKKFNEGEIYLELIQDGFLMIFQNGKAFKNYHTLPKEKMERELKQMDEDDKSFLFDKQFFKKIFPKKGIILNSEGYSGNLHALTPIVKNFYEKMHPDIQVIPRSDKLVQIHLKSIDATYTFINFLYWKIYTLKNQ